LFQARGHSAVDRARRQKERKRRETPRRLMVRLYQTREGAFFKIVVNYDGNEVLKFEPISDTEAKKLTEKYANHLVEKYFDVVEGGSAESRHTNPPTVNESLSRPRRRGKAASERLRADQER